MWDVLFWIFMLAVCSALIVGGVWYYTTQMEGSQGASGLFGARHEKRLGVVEQSNVDGRRKLVLIRRDNVEHLIMTGGPVDVVIETEIKSSGNADAGVHDTRIQDQGSDTGSSEVFTRTPRRFGAAVGE